MHFTKVKIVQNIQKESVKLFLERRYDKELKKVKNKSKLSEK